MVVWWRCAIEGEGVSRNSPRVCSLSRARATTSTGNFIPGRLVSPASCSSSVSSVLSLAIPFFFSPLTPTASPPPALSEGLDPGERTVVVLAGGFFFAFAIQPLSPSRFLPPDVSPCALLARPERKSWELNECRVPLEGSLSMPTRETPVLAS